MLVKNIRSIFSRLMENDDFLKTIRRPFLDYLILARLIFCRVVELKDLDEDYEKGIYTEQSPNFVNGKMEPPLYYVILNDCYMTSSNIIITKEDEIVLRDSGFYWLGLIWNIKKDINNFFDVLFFVYDPIQFLTQEPTRRENNWMTMGKREHFYTYGHFLKEYLPILRVFNLEEVLEYNFCVALPVDSPSFVIEILKKANKEVDYEFVDLDEGTQVFDKLLVCERRYAHRRKFTATSSDISYIRSLMEQNKCVSRRKKTLVISREDTIDRKILNLNKLISEIKCKNLEIVTFSDMSMDMQISVVQHSKNIIGPNGSNLANTIFADDANIVEIYNEKLPTDISHKYMAVALGNNYNRVEVPTVGSNYYLDSKSLSEIESFIRD